MTEIVEGLPQDQHEYGIDKGYSPIAEKVVLVDFDSTLRPWAALNERDIPPIAGSVEAMQEIVKRGYTIYIFTSRLSRAWIESVVGSDPLAIETMLQEQIDFVGDYCFSNNIPFIDIIGEKRPAIAYIDDKAIGFRGNWEEVLSDDLIK